MAFTQADLDTIDRTIALAATGGTLKVRFSSPGGSISEVEYRSLAEMMTARTLIARELARSAGGNPSRPIQAVL